MLCVVCIHTMRVVRVAAAGRERSRGGGGRKEDRRINKWKCTLIRV